jgi:hypothetical protein
LTWPLVRKNEFTPLRYQALDALGGYKVHFTESCDEGFHLIHERPHDCATAPDVKQLCTIQQRLAASGVLPTEQPTDASDLFNFGQGLGGLQPLSF